MDNKNSIFDAIYEGNIWGCEESVSGSASTLSNTQNLRKVLPELFEAFNINSIIDAPCGDMNWFSQINFKKNIKYYGFDIVEGIIEQNKNKFKDKPNYIFEKKDAISEPLPEVDLIFCRDLIIHFPISAIYELIQNFIKSKSKYLLITQHIITNEPYFINKDIEMGQFTYRNLTKPPFNFPLPKLLIQEEWSDCKCLRCLAMYDISELDKFINY